jgi:hypothetical protein
MKFTGRVGRYGGRPALSFFCAKPQAAKLQAAACGLARWGVKFTAMATYRKPIVIAHHIMWTLYGWWLPNDPRGSTSVPYAMI